ncbi:MAG: hypothetical protein C0404_10960, partial [Verrucomicrobia bacterium]|nr:hypothetical protein [Verrucomicrobiota bacterium]
MNSLPADKNRRVLIIDDNVAIQEDFRKILSPGTTTPPALDAAETALFGNPARAVRQTQFEVDAACQGQEGVLLVRKALGEGRPYALAFVDIRMPPGWDGVETTQKLWEVDPDVQVVICTAYSDYSWNEMFKKIGNCDRLVILKKPFDVVEVLQLTYALTEKWRLHQQSVNRIENLESMVNERTSELRKANEDLGTISKRQEAVLSAVPDIIMEVNNSRVYTWANRAGVEFFGEDVIGKEAAFYFEGEQETYGKVQPLFDGNEQTIYVESWQRRKDGAKRLLAWWCRVLKDAHGRATGALSTAHDMTEIKLTEMEMRWKTALLEAQVNATIDGILIVDEKGKKIVQNQRYIELWKIPKSIVDNHDDKQQIEFVKNRIKDPARFLEKVSYLYTHPRETSHDEVEFKDGMILDRYSAPVIGGDGTYFGRIWAFRDITESKKADAEIRTLLEQSNKARSALLGILEDAKRSDELLRTSEQKYRTLFDDARDGMALADAETGVIVDCNTALCRMAEREKAELVGQSQAILHPPRDVVNGESASFRQHLTGDDGGVLETDLLTKSGKLISVAIRASRITMNGKDYLFGAFRDISERKQMQQQMLQHERMNALGQMASGIVHDFNNVLMPILGYSEYLMENPEVLDDRKDTLNSLKEIHRAAEDAREIVRQLREFYRPHDDAGHVPVNVNDIVQATVNMTRSKWQEESRARGAVVEVATDLAEVPKVTGSEFELREALTNLIINAVDAMPEGGTVRIASAVEGEWVRLTVGDTGTGMSEEVRTRCLEPFFSTKGDRGTGMGLAMVHGAIQRHKGTIEVQSEAGKGTSFILRLPISPDGSAGEAASDETLPACPPKRVLVVDDDPSCRSSVLRILRAEGHHVADAADGATALKLMTDSRFDILISDRAMPGMSGTQLAKEVRRLYPEIKVIMLTGFDNESKAQALADMEDAAHVVLTKPAKRNEILRT